MDAGGVEIEVSSDGIRLSGHLARPPRSGGAEDEGPAPPGLVLCHGFPAGPQGAVTSGQTYPEFAERLAADTGWVVVCFNFRGTGASEGDFSLGGWLADLRAVIDHVLARAGVSGVWLAGFSTGGSLAICAAAEDERVRGVAALAAPADFSDWADDPHHSLEVARQTGVVRTPGFPADFDAWARELREVRPVDLVGKIPPRPVLIVHGTADDLVPLGQARALAEAAQGDLDLRVLTGAGHRLRHDPRAVAVLIGWLERQQP